MSITAGQDILAADFVSTSAGSGDSGKVAKLDANGRIDKTAAPINNQSYATSTTGNDTYVITLSPALAAYAAGQEFFFKPDAPNALAATLNVNGLGAKSILQQDGSALMDNCIVANMVAHVIYDGTNMLLQNPILYQEYVFTATGTWVCPRGVTGVLVDIVAAGGGGGGQANNTGAGGAGGGGAGAKNVASTVVPMTGYTVTVGTGGAGGVQNNAGSTGGTSSFNGISKTGGSGGQPGAATVGGGGGAAGDATAGAGGGGGNGGNNGTAGSTGTGGGTGGTAGTNSGGNGGGGGGGAGGLGAIGGTGGTGVGGSGTVGGYGCGGGGGSNQANGGAGGGGLVIIKVPLTQVA